MQALEFLLVYEPVMIQDLTMLALEQWLQQKCKINNVIAKLIWAINLHFNYLYLIILPRH